MAPVRVGSNRAAQTHAENALSNCYSGHWSRDGLKSYMRYSLAGGYQVSAENVSGHHYCRAEPVFSTIREALIASMDGLMKSPGHRRNILDSRFKVVNLGLDWDYNMNLAVVQQFEGDYVDFDILPTIEGGELSITGIALSGTGFESEGDLIVVIYWDRPPRMLTRGQLARVYKHDNGRPIVGIGPPREDGNYPTRAYKYTNQPHPSEISPDAPPPQSLEEAKDLFDEAKLASESREEFFADLPMMRASEWKVSGHEFDMAADIGDVVEEYGIGVYTVEVWAALHGEPLVISKYSIWHGIERPEGYD